MLVFLLQHIILRL
jgi:hypothetical protein